MGDAPDVSRARISMGQVCGLIAFMLGAFGQAMFVVKAFTEATVKADTQRIADMKAQEVLVRQLDALVKEQAEQGKAIAGIVGTLKAQETLLGDVRDRVASIEQRQK